MEKACKSYLTEKVTWIHLNIQGDNNLLTKRYEKELKSEQIVCYQKILNQIQKLRASEASEEKQLIIMCGNCLFYPGWQAIICQFRQIIGGARGYSGSPP